MRHEGGTRRPATEDVDATAWYTNNSGSATHEATRKQPNGYGLYDTLGLLPGSTLTLPGRPATARDDHAALIAAIEQRDPDAAEDIARRHIRAAQQLRLTMGA